MDHQQVEPFLFYEVHTWIDWKQMFSSSRRHFDSKREHLWQLLIITHLSDKKTTPKYICCPRGHTGDGWKLFLQHLHTLIHDTHISNTRIMTTRRNGIPQIAITAGFEVEASFLRQCALMLKKGENDSWEDIRTTLQQHFSLEAKPRISQLAVNMAVCDITELPDRDKWLSPHCIQTPCGIITLQPWTQICGTLHKDWQKLALRWIVFEGIPPHLHSSEVAKNLCASFGTLHQIDDHFAGKADKAWMRISVRRCNIFLIPQFLCLIDKGIKHAVRVTIEEPPEIMDDWWWRNQHQPPVGFVAAVDTRGHEEPNYIPRPIHPNSPSGTCMVKSEYRPNNCHTIVVPAVCTTPLDHVDGHHLPRPRIHTHLSLNSGLPPTMDGDKNPLENTTHRPYISQRWQRQRNIRVRGVRTFASMAGSTSVERSSREVTRVNRFVVLNRSPLAVFDGTVGPIHSMHPTGRDQITRPLAGLTDSSYHHQTTRNKTQEPQNTPLPMCYDITPLVACNTDTTHIPKVRPTLTKRWRYKNSKSRDKPIVPIPHHGSVNATPHDISHDNSGISHISEIVDESHSPLACRTTRIFWQYKNLEIRVESSNKTAPSPLLCVVVSSPPMDSQPVPDTIGALYDLVDDQAWDRCSESDLEGDQNQNHATGDMNSSDPEVYKAFLDTLDGESIVEETLDTPSDWETECLDTVIMGRRLGLDTKRDDNLLQKISAIMDRQRRRRKALRRQILKHQPLIVGLQETKRHLVDYRLAHYWWGKQSVGWSDIPAIGTKGGIAIRWDTNKMEVLDELKGDKINFWEELSSIQGLWNLPWLISGDFNATRSANERTSARISRCDRHFFNQFISDFELLEFPSIGTQFSYCNQQTPPAFSKIDRFLTDSEWISIFGDLSEQGLGFNYSEHRLLLLRTNPPLAGPKPFRFQPHWLENPELLRLSEQWWKNSQVQGNPGFVLFHKLKLLRAKIRNSVKHNMGQLELNMDYWEHIVEEFEDNHIRNQGLSPDDSRSKVIAQGKLHHALVDVENFWHRKANIQWNLRGDNCTKFFHKLVNIRSNSNSIHQLMHQNQLIQDANTIGDTAVTFFSELYSEKDKNMPDFEDLSLPSISTDNSLKLESPFSESEILSAITDLAGDKTPGPDGFPLQFYKLSWNYMKHDILRVFTNFFNTGYLEWRLNNNFISLAPKKPGLKSMGDFRPICLLSGIYKILAKLLATGLKAHMSPLVAQYQSAGVPSRNIQDTILIANELIDSLQQSKKAGLLLKLDFYKAFDTVSWSFLDKVLEKLGFGTKWRLWMRTCWNTSHFSIIINGTPHGPFNSTRGLRQGDPLSPMLFVLAVEVLSALVIKAQHLEVISGLRVTHVSTAIPILQFADDTLLLLEGGKSSFQTIKQVINCFEAISGLEVNCSKSSIYTFGDSDIQPSDIRHWNCITGHLPDSYLGGPLDVGFKHKKFWDQLLERMNSKLATWKRNYLSKGGRLVLIQSMLAYIPVYLLSLLMIPKGVAKDTPLEMVPW